jgi:hypothetical protein
VLPPSDAAGIDARKRQLAAENVSGHECQNSSGHDIGSNRMSAVEQNE